MRRTTLVLCDDCPRPTACDTPENVCDAVRLVDRTTRAQGLHFAVEDPETLRKIEVLLGEHGPKSPKRT